MNIIVTGGCGFIGLHLIKKLFEEGYKSILNIDKLSYSSMPEALKEYNLKHNYKFKKIDICDKEKIIDTFNNFSPDIVFHLAAESHVDNSIENPNEFIQSNIIGTYNILEASRIYLKNNFNKQSSFKLIHISTDEVYGSLKINDKPFFESSNYSPNSPYAASKASSDLLVKSWASTYKIPIIITHCTNNYGSWQFPEKLIPVIIYNCLKKQKIPIYGNGKNIRDWIHVEDHVNALITILKDGEINQIYNIGSNNEFSNIKIVNTICEFFNKNVSESKFHYQSLISFVEDRKGHDFRYAIDSSKITKELNFKNQIDFSEGIKKTINWYIKNKEWLFEKRGD